MKSMVILDQIFSGMGSGCNNPAGDYVFSFDSLTNITFLDKSTDKRSKTLLIKIRSNSLECLMVSKVS